MSVRFLSIVLIAGLISTGLVAEDTDPESEIQGKGGEKGDLNLNKAYLDLFYMKDDVRRIRGKSEVIDKELDGTGFFSESFKPLEKIVQTVDKIYLHPKRSVTVMLPAGSEITHLTPTFSAKFIEYDETRPSNIFTVLSMPSFVSGDVTVYYSIRGKSYIMKLICEKYAQTNDTTQSYYSVIAYKEAPVYEPFDVMEAYKKEYGSYPIRKYSFITLNGMVFKIIEDRDYGSLSVPNGKKYRVEAQINQKN